MMWTELLQDLVDVLFSLPAVFCYLTVIIFNRETSINLLPSWTSVTMAPAERMLSWLQTVLSFSDLFFTSVRVAQILVVAHKPRPPGLCIWEAQMVFCYWLVKRCQGRQDEGEAVTVSSQALIHEMKLLSDNGNALLLKQPAFSEM